MNSSTKPKISELKRELLSLGTKQKARASARFFKIAPGQYSAGDIFLGVTMPEQRQVASKYLALSLADLTKLLHSKEHEFRMTALIILVQLFQIGTSSSKTQIFQLYLRHTKYINNWDLVDASAEHIVGAYLYRRPGSMLVLSKLAKSKNIWERRIAMVATFNFIKQGESSRALRVAKLLLSDKHDLIQKAVGWMLREIGKRVSQAEEEQFLQKNIKQISRVTLRYAIERFSSEKRKQYLRL